MLIQVILIVLALFFVVRTWRQFAGRRLSALYAIAWTVFWLMVGGAALLPQSADLVAKFFGVERGADLAVYLSVVFLFYLVFRLFIKTEESERNLTKLVRFIALQEGNKVNQSQSKKEKDDDCL